MGDINIDAGLSVKADVNNLLAEAKSSYAKYKEDRRFDKGAYEELLGKYAQTVLELEQLKNKVEDLVNQAAGNKIPDVQEIQSMEAVLGILGAKKQDGTLDLAKLMELGEQFGKK